MLGTRNWAIRVGGNPCLSKWNARSDYGLSARRQIVKSVITPSSIALTWSPSQPSGRRASLPSQKNVLASPNTLAFGCRGATIPRLDSILIQRWTSSLSAFPSEYLMIQLYKPLIQAMCDCVGAADLEQSRYLDESRLKAIQFMAFWAGFADYAPSTTNPVRRADSLLIGKMAWYSAES